MLMGNWKIWELAVPSGLACHLRAGVCQTWACWGRAVALLP